MGSPKVSSSLQSRSVLLAFCDFLRVLQYTTSPFFSYHPHPQGSVDFLFVLNEGYFIHSDMPVTLNGRRKYACKIIRIQVKCVSFLILMHIRRSYQIAPQEVISSLVVQKY